MAQVLVNDSSLSAIADAIRDKLDVETTYLPSQMAAAIGSIETGGTDLTSEDEGKVVVESSGEYVLQAQTSRSITQNGTYDTTTNDEVVVNVSGGGGSGAGWASVDVFANPVSFSGVNGVTIESQSRSGNSVTLNLKEFSSQFEGFCLPISGLVVGDIYKFEFTYQLTSGAYFANNQYQLGYLISTDNKTGYTSSAWGNNVTPRDMDEHTFSRIFYADATTMYFSMALSGMNDNTDNYFTLSNMNVKHFTAEG